MNHHYPLTRPDFWEGDGIDGFIPIHIVLMWILPFCTTKSAARACEWEWGNKVFEWQRGSVYFCSNEGSISVDHCCVVAFLGLAMETAEGSMRTLAAGTRRGFIWLRHFWVPHVSVGPTKTPTSRAVSLGNLWEAVATARKELGIKGGFEKLRGWRFGRLAGFCVLITTPWKINMEPKMQVWKIIFLSKWVISRFHVNLPWCMRNSDL